MGGLYNTLFGINEVAPMLLKCLALSPDDIPRFRDCYLNGEDIVIHTRTGGGNREDYEKENAKLQAHPNYLRDEDDDFDCTYANFYFSFPKEYAEDLKAISQQRPDIKPSEKWQALFKERDAEIAANKENK